MKIKAIIIVSLLFSFWSCKKTNEQVDYVLFSGEILNYPTKDVIILGNDFEKNIPVSPEGTFADTLKISSNGYFTYKIGYETSSIYLKKGDQLHLSIDPKQFDESIKYTGTGAETNNYLAEKFLINEKSMPQDTEGYKKLYSSSPSEYKGVMAESKQKKLDFLQTYKNLDSEFKDLETKEINFEYINSLIDYEGGHSYFTNNENYLAPEGFVEGLKEIDLDNAENFKTSNEYKKIVIGSFERTIFQKTEIDSISVEKALKDGLSAIKSPNIKESLIKNISKRISPREKNVDDIYNFLMNTATDENFKAELTTTYEKIKSIGKGKISPTFEYENYKGGKTSLSDLKGKYVYVDVWATWCGPCKREIPFMQKIEEQYHGKNIEFVSISVDKEKDHDAWKKMIKDKKMGGIQLFADKSWDSQFVKDYQIQGIPRFILIDPDGKIENANAPSPSDSKLITLFSELGI